MIGVFYRAAFDISCLYALAVYFFFYALGFTPSPLTFGCFMTAALILAASEKAGIYSRRMAFASLLVPAAAFLMETTGMGRVLVILLWAYLAVLVVRGSYAASYYQFTERFKLFLWGWIIPGLFALYNLEQGISALSVSTPYLLVFLASGVMMLQALRYRTSTESRKQFERFQIVQAILFFAASVLLTAAGILDRVYYGVFQPVWKAASALVAGVFRKLMVVLSKTVQNMEIDFSMDLEGFQEALENAEPAEKFVQGGEWGEVVSQTQQAVEEIDYTAFWMIAGIIGGIIILAVLLSNRGQKVQGEELEVEREALAEGDAPVEEKPKKRSFEPALVIRYYYREFMRKAETREQELFRSDTTEEIAEKYKGKNAAKPEKAEEITAIYRKARYSGKRMTKEEAARMKKLAKEA